MSGRDVRRIFLAIDQGQVHCRIGGAVTATDRRPLLLLHGGPTSSASLAPMLAALTDRGFGVIAPDMMGNGQSDPPPVEPDIAFYAHCALRVLDRLGVQCVDCYGHHVGAQIACELAISAPRRVGRLILDGVGLYSAEQRREFLARYAPPIVPDPAAQHIARLWQFLTDATVRFPHYSEEPADMIADGSPLPPVILTDILADVVGNWRTYHLSYRAGFSDDIASRLPLVTQPTTVLDVDGDPLARHAASVVALLPDARKISTDRAGKADAIESALKSKIS